MLIHTIFYVKIVIYYITRSWRIVEIKGNRQSNIRMQQHHIVDHLLRWKRVLLKHHCHSYVPSFQHHLNIMQSTYELQTSDFVELACHLDKCFPWASVWGRFGTLGSMRSSGKSIVEVTSKFYKVRGLQFVSWSHNI